MSKVKIIISLVMIMTISFFSSCHYQQQYVNRSEVAGRSRTVAVLPLVNLTSYPHAGRIVGDLLTTELLALSRFRIMERTELINRLKGREQDLDDVLDRTVALEIGQELGVDSVIYGSVSEYHYKRGLNENPVVGINIRMIDIATKQIVWAGSRSETGGCFWFCEDSLNRLAQKTCHKMVMDMLRE